MLAAPVRWMILSLPRTSVVGVRSIGDHPCPRCLVSLDDVHNMGTTLDREIRETRCRVDNEETRKKIAKARQIIAKKHFAVNSSGVEIELKPTSLVPAQVCLSNLARPVLASLDGCLIQALDQNAFSDRLSRFGFDVYRTAAVDILHEVEIGVWKSLFVQLLRLVEATEKPSLNVLNHR